MDFLKAVSAVRRASELPVCEAPAAICAELHKTSGLDVLLADGFGRLLAAEHTGDAPYRKKPGVDGKTYIDSQLTDQFGGFSEMRLLSQMDGFYFMNTSKGELKSYSGAIWPINYGGERLATLLLYTGTGKITDNGIIFAEICLAPISVLLRHMRAMEDMHSAQKNLMVETAIATLSYSELEAVLHMFRELDSDEGLIVASKIADKSGVARSVIVSALRKFESAGVIETRSLGVKGTHIKVLNDFLLPQMNKMQR